MGYPAPPDHYSPLHDLSFTPNQRIEAFTNWVTGYFHHPSLDTLGNLKDITKRDIDEVKLEYHNILPSPLSSIFNMSPDEVASNVDPSVAAEGKGYTRHCLHSFACSAATCRLAVAVVAQASAAVSAEARRRSLVAVHTRVPVIV